MTAISSSAPPKQRSSRTLPPSPTRVSQSRRVPSSAPDARQHLLRGYSASFSSSGRNHIISGGLHCKAPTAAFLQYVLGYGPLRADGVRAGCTAGRGLIAPGWCGSIASASTAAVWPLSLVAATFAAGGAADTSGSGSPSCIITTTTGPWQRAPRRTELLPAVRADGSPRRVRAYARASRRTTRRRPRRGVPGGVELLFIRITNTQTVVIGIIEVLGLDDGERL